MTHPVDVWRVQLDGDGRVSERLHAMLDRDERERASAMRFPCDQARFIAAHSALRDILSRYLGGCPADVEFARGPSGKPRVDGSSLSFSLAHSDSVALVAISHGRPVGVDVEHVDDRPGTDHVARRFYTRRERSWIAEAHPDERRRRFFRVWTWKECCVKEDGRGVAGLSDVRVDPSSLPRLRAGRWRILEVDAGPCYAAALAMNGDDPAVVLRDLPNS
jgi:4'-phosphopantetheinyl transferase